MRLNARPQTVAALLPSATACDLSDAAWTVTPQRDSSGRATHPLAPCSHRHSHSIMSQSSVCPRAREWACTLAVDVPSGSLSLSSAGTSSVSWDKASSLLRSLDGGKSLWNQTIRHKWVT